MKSYFLVLWVVAVVLAGGGRARATTYIWYGDYSVDNPYYGYFDYSWNNAYNWYPLGVPGPGDTAVITNAGSVVDLNYSIYSSISVGNLVVGAPDACSNNASIYFYVQNKTINLSGQLTVNPCATFYFGSGVINGVGTNATLSGTVTMTGAGQISGNLNVGTNGVFNIASAGDHNWPNYTLNNYGTVAWSAGRIRGGGLPGTVINNYGVWDSQGDLTLNADYGGDGFVFNNFGTFLKSAGTGYTTLSGVAFYSAGGVDVESGTVNLPSGGTLTGGLETGSGTLLLSAGGFNLNGMLTTTNLQLAGAYLYGANVINGALTWVVGDWINASFVTIASNSTVFATSAYDHNLAYITVTNFGTFAWTGPGRVRGGGLPGTQIYNYGLWDAQGDWVFNDDYGLDGTTFNNYGTLRKSAGTGSTTLGGGVYLANAGTLDIESGTLSLNGSAWLGGGAQTGPGTLVMAAGGFTLNGTVTTTNALLAGGVLYGDNIVNGGLVWWSGDWVNANSVTIASNSMVFVQSGNDHNLAYINVTNYGTVAWSSGRVRGGGLPGTAIYNYGLWDIQDDLVFNDDYGVDGTVFNNYGTLQKSGGNSTATTFGTGVFLASTGTINVETGYLVLAGGGALTGGVESGAGWLQMAAGGFNINGLLNSTNLQMAGGTLYGSNYLASGMYWYGGNWNSASSVTLSTNAVLTILSAADHDLASCTLNNYGTVTWTGGRLRGGGNPGTVFNNYGLWDSQADLTFNSDYQYNGFAFNNYGTLLKSGGTGYTTVGASAIGPDFRNSGVVTVASGVLLLGGGGLFTGGSVTGNGGTYLNAGSFTINKTVTTSNLWQTGGTLAGQSVINGGFTWNNGNWNGASSVTIQSNSTVFVVSGANHDLANCTVTNWGTLNWVAGPLRGGGNPGTVVQNFGLWDAQSDSVFNSDYQYNGLVFNNLGTFRKSGGSVSTVFSPSAGAARFNNQGRVLNLTPGPIYWNGGGVFSAGSVSGLAVLGGGSFNINGTVTTTNVQETGGYLYGSNVLSGGFTWSAGANWNGISVTVSSNTELDIVSGANHDLANATVNNFGRVEWLGGNLRGGSNPGSVINNNGLWEVQCDAALNSDYGLNGIVFNNAGTFHKFNTLGATSWSPSAGSALFNGLGGAIELDSGTLVVNNSLASTGGLTIGLGGTNSGQCGRLIVNGLASVGGPLTVFLANNFQPYKPEQFTILSAALNAGSFPQATLPAGLVLVYTNNVVYLQATNVMPVPITSQVAGGNFNFSFPTIANQTYDIQITTNLCAPWTTWLSMPGDGTIQQYTLPITNSIPGLFLRVSEP